MLAFLSINEYKQQLLAFDPINEFLDGPLSLSLVGLPTSLGFLNEVEFLDVGLSRDPERRRWPTRNCISIIPKSIAHLKKLQYLNLSGNSVRQLPDNFGSLVSLTQLDLGK